MTGPETVCTGKINQNAQRRILDFLYLRRTSLHRTDTFYRPSLHPSRDPEKPSSEGPGPRVQETSLPQPDLVAVRTVVVVRPTLV